MNSYFYEELDEFKPPLIVALPPVTSPVTPVTSSTHSSIKAKPQNTPPSMNALDKPPNYDALYAASDVISSCVPNIPSLQGVSGNNVYAVPNSDILVSSVDCALVEFPRRNLRFVEVLGEGEFGEVSSMKRKRTHPRASNKSSYTCYEYQLDPPQKVHKQV